MESLFKNHIILVSLLVLSIFFFQPKKEEPAYQNNLLENGEVRLYNLRQLTFSGENAEAYFSASGKQLVFQSHDGDSLCDQIYIMDIASGQTKMVSTGFGAVSYTHLTLPTICSV